MAIEVDVNGNVLTFPDIPADVLATYPYAAICGLTDSSTGEVSSEMGYLIVSDAPAWFVSADLVGTDTFLFATGFDETAGEFLYGSGGICMYAPAYGATDWVAVDGFDPMLQLESGMILVWANYIIYYLGIDDNDMPVFTDEVYFATADPPPEEYAVTRTWLVAIADEVRRLTSTTDTLTTEEMQSALENVDSEYTVHDTEDSLVSMTLAGDYANDRVTSIREYAFYKCGIKSANFPIATEIGQYAFYYCSKLATVNFPLVRTIGTEAFRSCTSLTKAVFPLVTSIVSQTFYASGVEELDLPSVTSIANYALNQSDLATLILRSGTVCSLGGTKALSGTPIEEGTGYIYVPSALVDTYKAAENWSTYAAQFRALEDYTVDGTTTGALDESKI